MGWELWDTSRLSWEEWRSLLRRGLRGAGSFQIHCWSDELLWIALALEHGAARLAPWQWGTVIEGPVTPAFRAMLLGLQRPAPEDGYQKFTPFFSIFLDNGFGSFHYGTELVQGRPGPLPFADEP